MDKRLLILFLTIFISLPSYASNTLVFIHGYQGDGSTWRPTGIIYALQRNGWQDSGHLFPQGPTLGIAKPSPTGNYMYTVTLPSEAPLAAQARWLDVYLRNLKQRHPDNSLVLVGHSAGGIVARLVMVTGKISVKGLISIASPHLGTDKAELGTAINNSPASMFTPMLGLGSINRSQGLYYDLTREHPRSLLFWLNRQPHPQGFYISIIRNGDGWVAPYSQNMNNVVALRGLSKTVITVGEHSLNPSDGPLLVNLLNKYLK
ncbi:alpha/beta fold hydrolase [Candidatus Halobeggiatoa sp. HSG11]|nr:alpha/beta fold hydrolase [Candidatus Halobeggiatoa sp. HSG11]